MKHDKRLLFAIGLGIGLAHASAQAAITLTTLASFNGTNGAYPLALIQRADGSFFGTARHGGSGFDPNFLQGNGTIFKVTASGGLSNLVMLNNDRANPGYLVQAADQNYYGTLLSGEGALFKLTSDGSLTDFNPVIFGGTNGLNPVWLVEDRVGNLYGVTLVHDPGTGSVFKSDTNATFTTVAVFHGTNGAYPGPMLLGLDGNFYGVAQAGGFMQNGTIYKLTPDGNLSALVSFQGANGSSPAWLLQKTDGHLYGVTAEGGLGYGSIFKVTTSGSFVWSYLFNGTNGSFPSFLMQGADGNLYGSTTWGGSGFNGYSFSGNGTLFKITPAGEFTSLLAFDGTNGAEPFWMIVGDDGQFYGTTRMGGPYGWGTVFRLNMPVAPVIQEPVRANHSVVLTWNAVAEYNYQLQSKSNLTSTNWNNVGNVITATNGTVTISDSIGADPQKFYRVILLP